MNTSAIDARLIGAITMALRRAPRNQPALDLDELAWKLRNTPFQWSQFRLAEGRAMGLDERRQAVLNHLSCMEAMGLVTRVDRWGFGPDPHGMCWRFSNQAELGWHIAGEADLERQRQPLEVLTPPPPPDRGVRGGGGGRDGGRGGGNDGSNDNNDGPGGGIGEVLAHPVLFALPADDFETLVNNLFNGPGAP